MSSLREELAAAGSASPTINSAQIKPHFFISVSWLLRIQMLKPVQMLPMTSLNKTLYRATPARRNIVNCPFAHSQIPPSHVNRRMSSRRRLSQTANRICPCSLSLSLFFVFVLVLCLCPCSLSLSLFFVFAFAFVAQNRALCESAAFRFPPCHPAGCGKQPT